MNTVTTTDDTYRLQLTERVASVALRMREYSDAMTEAGQDAKLITDRAWLTKFAAVLGFMRRDALLIKGLKAPENSSVIHSKLSAVGQSFDRIATLHAAAFDTGNAKKLDEAIAEVGKLNTNMAALNGLIKARFGEAG